MSRIMAMCWGAAALCSLLGIGDFLSGSFERGVLASVAASGFICAALWR